MSTLRNLPFQPDSGDILRTGFYQTAAKPEPRRVCAIVMSQDDAPLRLALRPAAQRPCVDNDSAELEGFKCMVVSNYTGELSICGTYGQRFKVLQILADPEPAEAEPGAPAAPRATETALATKH